MFYLPTCGTVTDSVTLLPVGDITKLAPEMDKARKLIKQLSNSQFLISQIQKGEVMMANKITFDNYLKSNVDLMKAYVANRMPCEFSYSSFFTGKPVKSSELTIKEQWMLEILMCRLNLCAIYQLGAYSSLEKIFIGTAGSYGKEFKQAGQFSNNLQITFRYFHEGHQPLKRISQVFGSLQQLVTSPQTKEMLEFRRDLFEITRDIIECNLAYLKLQKYRILQQYKNCKEGALAVVNRVTDLRQKLTKYLGKDLNQNILVFLKISELFYKVYALYSMLQQHQHMKVNEDYGFVKKEFQSMLMDNLSAIAQMQKLQQMIRGFPDKTNYDNVMFAEGVVDCIMEDVARFGVNLHQNKSQMPPIEDVIARRIGVRNLWESLNNF